MLGTSIIAGIGFGVVGLTVWALTQREHSLLRIFGPLALTRWAAESVRDKLAQYSERSGDGRPFARVTREWVYRASKGLSTSTGFGTKKDLHCSGTHTIRPAPFGITASEMPNTSFGVAVGRGGRRFIVSYPMNRSGGSFGAFGAHWTRAASDGCGILNLGHPACSGFLDNTGEGGLSAHHLSCSTSNQAYLDRLNARARACGHDYLFRFDKTGTSDGKVVSVPLDLKGGFIDGDGRYVATGSPTGNSELPRRIIVQIGPSLSGFRTSTGDIDWDWLDYVCGLPDVVGVEVKGQQGAKPNDGGTVKAAKLTAELRALRGFTGMGDYVSPERLPFVRPQGLGVGLTEQVDDLVAVITRIQQLPNVVARGLIVGYKMTYCGAEVVVEIARHLKQGAGPDYIIVDGAEGGTGAADPTMTDHVGVHLYQGIARTHDVLVQEGVRESVRLVASGRVATSADIAKVMCIGADYCNGIRGFMMSTGCIQATECHSGKCPTGITTHNSWSRRGFDPTLKAVRFANYGLTLRSQFVKLARVAGVRVDQGERFDRTHLDVVTGIGQVTRGDVVYGQVQLVVPTA